MSLTQSSKMDPTDEEEWTTVSKKSNKKEKMSVGAKKQPRNKNDTVVKS